MYPQIYTFLLFPHPFILRLYFPFRGLMSGYELPYHVRSLLYLFKIVSLLSSNPCPSIICLPSFLPSLLSYPSSFPNLPPFLPFLLSSPPHTTSLPRSHLSWGQMVACYARPCCSVPRVGPWVGAPVLGPQAPGCHLYPVIFLLVTSHLLVFWLIISLLVALDYQ